ncbi:MAG: TraR/DksA family transcriptional regulator [Ktedonobacteraceae bacterium]|nr:TraR/DksA family transcriptional regulator [Ktedonobacteraceae bacterium]
MPLDIQQVKQRLKEKQAELQEQISSQTEVRASPSWPTDASEAPQDFEDTAVDFLETQQEQSTVVNAQALLTEVQDALKRIEDGTYGRCVVCGQPIPERRLQAIPWASRCLKDQAQLEQRNLSREELYGPETF